MIRLTLADVQLNTAAVTKAEAIQQAGALLVKTGHIQPGYIDSMFAREQAANTYLGNGIAIPHGKPEDRDLILNTGIAVVQIPQGVTWNKGETVRLVVGIAARSDEHLDILTNLTHVLDDSARVEGLAHTQNAQEIVDALMASGNRTSGDRTSQPAFASDVTYDYSAEIVIEDKAGLHARPATALVALAKSFSADVAVEHNGQCADGKRLMSLLQLGVRQGDRIRLLAKGHDAQQAVQALQEAIERGLDEESETDDTIAVPALQLETEGISGIAAAPGIVIAPLYHYRARQLLFAETADDPEIEADRLKEAIALAKQSLSDLSKTVMARSGKGQAAIFKAHQELLSDPALVTETVAKLPPNRSAAWAWQQVIESQAQTLAAMDNPVLAGRATDVRDVGQRVLALLADEVIDAVNSGEALPEHPAILIADELTPSDTASLDTRFIKGFCTAKGGATSHTAIIARSLNLPAVVGAGEAVLTLPAGQTVLLDGNGGTLYPNPTEADLKQAKEQQQQQAAQQDQDYQARFQPAITKDGHRVEVVANIGKPQEAQQAIDAGGEGVGLLRTEFLFLNRDSAPTEEEQFSALTQMTQALNGLPLIVRTLDIGGDKSVPYINMPAEENPFLGVRGIRLCLERIDLFESQLRAILRAAQGGYIRVMFPMIATLEDLRAGKAVLESVRATLDAPPVEVGMMVEVPSAVLMADAFAQEVDFFSVGTNDLTQYLLAMDRGHPVLAKQADALHPAVLRAIHQTVQAAAAAGKWVGVCGGVASEPLGAILLAGLGVTELSVDIPTIPAVKATIRRRSLTQMQTLAQRALRCKNAEEVRGL